MLGKLMKRMMKMAMKPLDLLDNKIVSAAVKIFLVLYAGAVAPQLPRSLAKLMKNNKNNKIIDVTNLFRKFCDIKSYQSFF